MLVRDVTRALEEIAPLAHAEDFDNVGLLVGDYQQEVKTVLISLDCLEETVDEAIEKSAELIICFHPIIFKGIKKLTGSNYVERTVIKAIKNGISIYATHTALDNSQEGVNKGIMHRLGISAANILIPKKNSLKQLTFTVPKDHVEQVKTALFEVGLGKIGHYDQCSFQIKGEGNFRPLEGSSAFIGQIGKRESLDEYFVKGVFESRLENKILSALNQTHPYEKVAYEIIALENPIEEVGMGMIGELKEAMDENSFLTFVKDRMNTKVIRHSGLLSKEIKKVAVLGGSGSFALSAAKAQHADAFISADFKYHDFFQAEKQILICDIGHYESEQFTKELIYEHLRKNFPNFAFILSSKNTNPIHYS